MEQLSGLDATFLYLETDNAPMHIGGVSIIDPNQGDGSRFGLEDLRRLMAARLDGHEASAKIFRQRLAEVPLDLGRPYWVEDERFDLDRHIERTQLPEPGGAKELAALAAWEFAERLERDRPLWKFLLVEGVDTVPGVPKGSIAVISRVHHAAIDGVSGAEILSALFDVEPRQPKPQGTSSAKSSTESPAEPDTATGASKAAELDPDNPVDRVKLLWRAKDGLAAVPRAGGRVIQDVAGGLVKSGALRLKRVKPPPSLFTAPRTRFNAPVSKRRVWGCTWLDLERVIAAKRAAECTVNDVVLTICSGALRRYLEERDELPDEPLVAMVPISVRGEEGQGAMGNQVSAMLVSLATDVEDPLERLNQVRSAARESKVYHQALGASTLADYSEAISFGLAGLAARLYTRMSLADSHRPIFNLVITNVPGPQVPLYMGESRLLAHAGTAPIFDGMGLILPVLSYAGRLAISAFSCPKMLPEARELMDEFQTSLDELTEALGGERHQRIT